MRVGEKEDDKSYERAAVKKMKEVGISISFCSYSETVEKEWFYQEVKRLNEDDSVDGILILRPLPVHLEEEKVASLIRPEKDVDGFSFFNLGKLLSGDLKAIAPCTARAVLECLRHEKINLRGKKVTIIGRSSVVGRPLAALLIGEDATVTVCHTKTLNLKEVARQADILVAACGVPKMITGEYVAEGAVVIDVGIHVLKDGSLCGDVDVEDIREKVSLCTPVPKGVGAVTTSVLARQILDRKNKKKI